MPLFMIVKFVQAIDFVTGHDRAFDLVHLYSGIGHSRDVPHLVPRPPYFHTRAGGERVVVRGVHSDGFVVKDVESKSHRVPGN